MCYLQVLIHAVGEGVTGGWTNRLNSQTEMALHVACVLVFLGSRSTREQLIIRQHHNLNTITNITAIPCTLYSVFLCILPLPCHTYIITLPLYSFQTITVPSPLLPSLTLFINPSIPSPSYHSLSTLILPSHPFIPPPLTTLKWSMRL